MSSDLSPVVEFRRFGFEIEGVELVRAEGGDGREVTGIAVPYGVDQLIYPGLVERFELGSFAHQIRAIPQRTHFSREHMSMGGQLIGRVSAAEEVAKGLRLSMRVSKIQLGDETLTLIDDGVLDELSIGFIARSNDKPDASGVTIRRKADLTEISIVHRGAYGRKAKVDSIRSEAAARMGSDVAAQLLARLPLPDMIG